MTGDPAIAPLKGVRVIELGNYIAAPTAGRILADFGAEVIKVERPGSGDELRRWRLYGGETSMLFRTINRNKKSIVLDLSSKAGQQVVRELAAKSDVVLENFRPGTLERWGIGPAELSSLNPGLIVARISAFGQTGPLANRPGFAAVAEAFGGMRALVGERDRPPVRIGISIGDSIAGIYAAFGATMALFERNTRRDQGPPPLAHRVVDVALHEAVFSVMESLVPDYAAYGVRRVRTGGRMEGIAPSNAYFCADGGSIVVAGNGDAIFRRFMRVIGRPDLADDPGLQSNEDRWERRDELDAAIGHWAGTRTVAEAIAALDSADVPAGPIYTAEDILSDAQFAARGMIQYLPVPAADMTDRGRGEQLREVPFPGVVPVMGGRSLPVRSLGPDLGAHTREVLEGVLGKRPDEIADILAGS